MSKNMKPKEIKVGRIREFNKKLKSLLSEYPEIKDVEYNKDKSISIVDSENARLESKPAIRTQKYWKEITKKNYQRTNWREFLDRKEFVIFYDDGSGICNLYLTRIGKSKKYSTFSFCSTDKKHLLFTSNFFEETMIQAIESGNSVFLFDSRIDVLDYVKCYLTKEEPIDIVAFKFNNETFTLVKGDNGHGFQSTKLAASELPLLFLNTKSREDCIQYTNSLGIDTHKFTKIEDFHAWDNSEPTDPEPDSFRILEHSFKTHELNFMSDKNYYCIIVEKLIYTLSYRKFSGYNFFSENGVSIFTETYDNPKHVLSRAIDEGYVIYCLNGIGNFSIWEEQLKLAGEIEEVLVCQEDSRLHEKNSLEPGFVRYALKFNGMPFEAVKLNDKYGFKYLWDLESPMIFESRSGIFEDYLFNLSFSDINIIKFTNREEYNNWVADPEIGHCNFSIERVQDIADYRDHTNHLNNIVVILKDNRIYHLSHINNFDSSVDFKFLSGNTLSSELFPGKLFNNFNKILKYAISKGYKIIHFADKGSYLIWQHIIASDYDFKIPTKVYASSPTEVKDSGVKSHPDSDGYQDIFGIGKSKNPEEITYAFERNGEIFKLVSKSGVIGNRDFAFVSLRDCFYITKDYDLLTFEDCIEEVTSQGLKVFEFDSDYNFKLWMSQVLNCSLKERIETLKHVGYFREK